MVSPPLENRLATAREMITLRALSRQALRLSNQTGVPRTDMMEILTRMLADGSLVVVTDGDELGALPVDDERVA